MAIYPVFQLPLSSTKIRFKEPFISEGLNRKLAGVIPTGIYRGFIPNPQPNFQLFINTDPVRNDSVSVYENADNYNLTIRYPQQIILDFTGQPLLDFPLMVVVRGEYSINADPFAGTTDAKVLAVKPTVNNADPGSLHDNDVKICKVTGIGPGDVPTIDESSGTNRDDGADLVTQQEFAQRMKIAVAEFPQFVGGNPVVRTVVHNFGLTGITSVGGSTTLYQTDQGLVLLIPYVTGFGEFSDTSTDWAFMVNGALTATSFTLDQHNVRQGCIQIAIVVMLFVGVQGVSGGGVPPSPQIFTLPLTPPPINFGNVVVGNDSAPQVIEVFNTGTLPLTVSLLVTGAPFFEVSNNVVVPPNAPIPPGGSGTITLKFTPSVLGAALGSINIHSDDPDDPILAIPLSGTGI